MMLATESTTLLDGSSSSHSNTSTASLGRGISNNNAHSNKLEHSSSVYGMDIAEENNQMSYHSSYHKSIYKSDVFTKSQQEQQSRRSRRLSFHEVVERITLTWNDISVWAPPARTKMCGKPPDGEAEYQPKQILHGVSGVVHPGTLLAIMGASGAGKTTLLNVLTYRNRGKLMVEGDVRVNGGKIGRGMPSLSAYVQQDDIFIGTLTVQEHLWFQSQLRMDKEVPYSIRKERVEVVMKEMSLKKCKDVFIGIPGKLKGVSGGEKKRLAFASEVLTNPPLMFCDEPTSGLDSFMARNIVQNLKSMASKGRTIICTIHQPSSEVFALFDRVLLMAEGRVAYMGMAKEAMSFFETQGFSCPLNYNPADHYVLTLAVIPGSELECRKRVHAICDSFTETTQAEDIRSGLKNANFSEDELLYDEEAFAKLSPYRASWHRQFMAVFWRSWLGAAREPGVFHTRLAQAIIMSTIFGFVYYQQELNQTGINNINGALFLMQTQMTFGFVFGVINSFPPEFPIFMREHMDGMYRVDVYFLSKTFAEIPQFVFIPFVFSVIMYWLVGLYPSAVAYLINLVVCFLTCNVAVSFGYVLSSSSSNVSFVLALGPIFVVPAMMIGGYYINSETIPTAFLWLKYLSWFTYANELMVINQWSRVDDIACGVDKVFDAYNTSSGMVPDSVSSGACIRTGDEVIQSLSYSEDNFFFDIAMMVVLLVGYRFLAFLILSARARTNYIIPKAKNTNEESTTKTVNKFKSIMSEGGTNIFYN